MEKLKLRLENCYGIKKLEKDFDFSESKTIAIYAPNGVMKTSFAKTFKKLSKGEQPKDSAFPARPTNYEIKDEKNNDLARGQIFVIDSYDEYFKSDKVSTLIANQDLRNKYEEAHKKLDEAKELFLKKIKKLSGLSGGLEEVISKSFSNKNFFDILTEQEKTVSENDDPGFAKVTYKVIFNDTALKLLQEGDFKKQIKEYIETYNNLLSQSLYLRKGFNHYNAVKVQKALDDEGFFKVGHSINLFDGKNGKEDRTAINSAEFQQIINDEKNKILNNASLQEKFKKIDDKIKNAALEELREYLQENQEILPELEDLDKFRKEIWTSYFIDQKDLYDSLLEEYKQSKDELEKIRELAQKEQGDWKEVVGIFNKRFSTPLKLRIGNQEDVILKGAVDTLFYDFEDQDTGEKTTKQREEIIDILSQGEKKALYLLNIIFEIEARKKTGQETLLIIDDIADSFDYKNKYAIIQYLKENSENPLFHQIILTHNFDFFRTISGRLEMKRGNKLHSFKKDAETLIEQEFYQKNPFLYWKKHLDKAPILIASIPFVRNIIEYTARDGEKDGDYKKITSLLHWKQNDTENITIDKLKEIFDNAIPGCDFSSYALSDKVFEKILEEAENCLTTTQSLNLENKIVLSIAIRLMADKFMVEKINDPTFTNSIGSNQTFELIKKYREKFQTEKASIDTLENVSLMTPENIHLNSFMYEPILDMSDTHLRKLYKEVKKL